MEAWEDTPYWKKALKPLAPAKLRPWISYGYWVLPQKAWSLLARTAHLPIASEPKWPPYHKKDGEEAASGKQAGQNRQTHTLRFRKALMVASKYPYGRAQDGPSYEHAHLLGALEANVGQVKFFDSLGTDEKLSPAEINRQLEKTVAEFKPDLIFIAPFRNELDRALVRKLSEKSGAVTVAYFLDDVWRFDIHSRGWGWAVHALASQDPLSIENWGKMGHRHQYMMPFGYTPEQFHPVKTPMKYDVSFLGAASHPGRREAVEYLRAHGQPVDCFGSGWGEGGRFADLSELPKIFASSKINLNFSRVSVPWESRRQLKGRVFEVTGCGGFLLTEYAPGLENLFEIGKEIEVFRTHEQMLEKIQYYLAHEDARAAIARAGLARAQKDHTDQKRFADLLGQLESDWKAQQAK